MKHGAITIMALLLGGNAFAHEGQEGRPHTHWWLEMPEIAWSAGVSLAQSSFDWQTVLDDGSFTSRSNDDSDLGWRIHVGADIGSYFGFELGYCDFGKATFRAQSDGSGTVWSAGPVAEDVEVDGFELTLVGRLPVNEDWALLAKAGAIDWDSSLRFAGDAQGFGPLDFRQSDNGTDLTYGAGVQYDGFRPWRLVGEYRDAPFKSDPFMDDGQVDSIGISLAYVF